MKARDYLNQIELMHLRNDCLEELKAVLNNEPTKNSTAILFRDYISQGLVSKSEAVSFVEGLVAIEESVTNQMLEVWG